MQPGSVEFFGPRVCLGPTQLVLIAATTRHVHETEFAVGRPASIEELVNRLIPGRLLAVLYEEDDSFHEKGRPPLISLVWCTLGSSRRMVMSTTRRCQGADVDSVQCVILEASGGIDRCLVGYPSDDELLVDFRSPRGPRGQVSGPAGHTGGLPGSTATTRVAAATEELDGGETPVWVLAEFPNA